MRPLSALLLTAGLFALGCSSGTPTPPPTVTTSRVEDDHGDHEHGVDKMMEEHAGKYHVFLTAHLSKTGGNELDIFFKTGTHEDLKPGPVPLAKFTAKAIMSADQKEHDLVFEPAPAEERKGDPPGQCSHFVAKAPWMTRDAVFTVRTEELSLGGKSRRLTWRAFAVKEYTHHED